MAAAATGVEPLPAAEQLLLRDVWVVAAPHQAPRRRDVLLDGGRIRDWSSPGGLTVADTVPLVAGADLWLGPSLVDPYSHLEEAYGLVDDLPRLAAEALQGGYGTVALSPQAKPWRDQPQELITGCRHGLELRSWGSFTAAGAGQDFSHHGALLAAGAVGLAEASCRGHHQLLWRGLQWQADAHHRGEGAPLAMAPRDPQLQAGGVAREGADALRLGLPTDPVASELLPLRQLLQAAQLVEGNTGLRLLNLSTAAAVDCLRRHPPGHGRLCPLVALGGGHLQPRQAVRQLAGSALPGRASGSPGAAGGGAAGVDHLHHGQPPRH